MSGARQKFLRGYIQFPTVYWYPLLPTVFSGFLEEKLVISTVSYNFFYCSLPLPTINRSFWAFIKYARTVLNYFLQAGTWWRFIISFQMQMLFLWWVCTIEVRWKPSKFWISVEMNLKSLVIALGASQLNSLGSEILSHLNSKAVIWVDFKEVLISLYKR